MNEGDQKRIIGTWQMIKLDIKDGVYFDVSDKDSSHKRFIRAMIQSRPGLPKESEYKPLSPEDSAWINNSFEKAFKEFKQLFVEFQKGNKYSTNQSAPEDRSTLTTGTFTLDTKKHILSRTQNGQQAKEAYYELAGDSLMIQPVESGNVSSTIIFKRIE